MTERWAWATDTKRKEAEYEEYRAEGLTTFLYLYIYFLPGFYGIMPHGSFTVGRSMSSIFEQIKEQTNILEIIAFYTEDELKKSGDEWYEMSDRSCPFCGHFDCFKVKYNEADSNYHCFSCEAHGDQIEFVQKYVPLSEGRPDDELSPVDAVKRIAKDFHIKLAMRALTPSERLLNAAAQYYHNRLLDSKTKIPTTVKGKEVALNPLDYQTKRRHHKVGSLIDMSVGYTDGDLCSYLLSIGESVEDILASGIGTLGEQDKKVVDYFPKGLFIYPMYKDGVCCGFSQKDPSGVIRFQFPNKFRLNDVLFLNQDSVKNHKVVYVVEGENDLLSLLDAKANGAVIATNGSVSNKQIDWIKTNLREKKIITIFDSDEAGDKYRTKFHEKIPGCVFIRLPDEYKDIDNYLESHSLESAMKYEVVRSAPQEEEDRPQEKKREIVSSFDADTGIMERNGCYYKIRIDKEGTEIPSLLSDFTIKLSNIYMIDGRRQREMVVTRSDGFRSNSMLLDSETKVSLKAFRTKMADAVDGAYYGSESDLTSLWRFIAMKNPEKLVDIPDYVGDLSQDGMRRGWLFKNCYIRATGEVIDADSSGVMWWSGNTKGIRPRSISEDLERELEKSGTSTIPVMRTDLTPDEVDSIEEEFIRQYVANFGGDIGKALLLISWARMVAFSNEVYNFLESVPFMHAWGGKGSGKSTILTWLLDIYGMGDNGYATLPSLGSSVGFSRKAAYYSGLPMCIDEIRIGHEMNGIAGKLRGWYNRSQQDIAASGSQTKIHERPMRAVIIFGGQDIFTDDALRERCAVVRVSSDGRELKNSYNAIQTMKEQRKLSAIGIKWIQEAIKVDVPLFRKGLESMNDQFKSLGVSTRTARTWSVFGYFAKELSEKFYPEFDMMKYLLDSCKEDSMIQANNSSLNHFYEIVEGMMSKETSPFTCEHFTVRTIKRGGVERKQLALWLPEIHRTVMMERRDRSEESFSKEAIASEIREEPYFVKNDTIRMGKSNSSRRVLIVDIEEESCPQSLKNIAELARGF